MNSKYLTLFSGFLFIIIFLGHYELYRSANKFSVNTEREKEEEEESGIPKKDRMDLAWQQEFELTKDPATNNVPRERLIRAFAYAQQLAASHANKTSGAITGITWRERGPNNVGGRTRAIMVDPNDPTKKTVWAGSVGGGLWKTTDITAASPNWMPVNDLMGNLAVTSIVYDPSNTQVMYFGTGEGVYNADAIRGLGIWKSTDGGATWSQLASTNNSSFYYTQRLAIASNGDIYAATSSGLRRSQNGGSTWSQVLGSGNGAATNSMGDVEIAANGTIYCGAGLLFSTDGVYKSATGNTGSWVKCNTGANGFPTTDLQRIKLACAPSNANVVYALCENGAYAVKGIYKTTDAGANWTACALPVDADGGIGSDFTRGQAWYDLSIAVDPNNANTLIVGGVDLFKSTNGGTSWTQISHWYGGFGYQEVHADQHIVLYEPGNSNVVYFGNDGGVWMSTNGNSVTPNIISKNDNYNVTQFYAGALNPGYHNNQMMSGAQDNGTNQTNNAAIGNSVEVTGGDGCFCHIDQDQPQYQFSSYVYNNYYRSVNTGVSFAGITSNNSGSFVNPTDYDDANNNLYACHANGDYYVMNNAPVSSTLTAVAVAAFGTGKVTHISVSPNTSNRVFFGLNNGYVVRVDNAHTTTPTATNIRVAAMPATSVSCIAVEKGNDNHLLATYSSYGVNSVWETTNGGSTWTSVEGNLPDMPVRWAMFSPVNSQQAMLATELGVWSTDMLSGGATLWGPSNTGLANVRVDMLQFRNSDSLIMAITHGRGNYTTDAFMSSSPDFTSDKVIAYTNKPIKFIDASYRANSWYWDFGDGTSSTLQNPTKNYSSAGLYTVTLTINGNLQKVRSNYIQILPNRGTPYTPADGGSFDINPLDFGADNFSGTSWQRGNSATAGKNGVFSGSNAWVTGLTGNYADNTDSRLMTPNFNLSAAGTYTLKLYRKNSFEIGYDGMRVEYTLDKGDSWLPLATTTSAGWYDFANAAATTAFPIGQAYFNNTQSSFLLCQYNISSLAGNNNVAFRVRFKSDGSAVAAGAAIDNFEITGSVNTPLPVSLISFTGENKSEVNQLKWITSNEINNSGFEIYRSIDAIQFEKIGFVPASATMSVYHNYSFNDTQLNSNTYYYKLNQVDINGNKHVSPVIVIKSKLNNLAEVNIFPQPANEYLNIDINETTKEPVELKIYNLNGQLVFSRNYEAEDQHLIRLNVKEIQLARNCYLLVLKTGSESFARKFIVE